MTTEKNTPIVKAVESTPKVTPAKEEMTTIFIDPEMVGKQGIRINEKVYVGHVSVPASMAKDILRIQEEYWETVKKLKDPNVNVRMKNDFQKEALFLADPEQYSGKKGFTRDYGLLGLREWTLCTPAFQDKLLETRRQIYGY